MDWRRKETWYLCQIICMASIMRCACVRLTETFTYRFNDFLEAFKMNAKCAAKPAWCVVRWFAWACKWWGTEIKTLALFTQTFVWCHWMTVTLRNTNIHPTMSKINESMCLIEDRSRFIFSPPKHMATRAERFFSFAASVSKHMRIYMCHFTCDQLIKYHQFTRQDFDPSIN